MSSTSQTPSTAQATNWNTHAAYVVTAVFIVLVTAWHLQFIGIGMITHFDEFYTYERSTGFARMGDWWAVYSGNEPSLKKPPLQYWMSGGLMELGVSDVIALRLPSMIFAALTLCATAVLARLVMPQHLWTMVAAVLIVASSQAFWSNATSAMLDMGSAFFVMLGLITMLIAFEKPRYWPLFAVAVFFGGLQKGPVSLAFVLIAILTLALTARLQDVPFSRRVLNKHFLWSLVGALLVAFIWQVFQNARFGAEDAIRGSFEGEMIHRFVPTGTENGPRSWAMVQDLILGTEPWPRLIGFIGLLTLPFLLGRPVLLSFAGIGIAFVAIMWSASGNVYGRYMLVLTPVLSVFAASLFTTLLRSDVFGTIAALVFSVVLGGPFIASQSLALGPSTRNGVPISDILTPLSQTEPDSYAFVACAFKKERRLPPGAITVYSQTTGRVLQLRAPNLPETLKRWGYRSGPLGGICSPGELDQLAHHLTDLQTSPLPGGYVQWQASGLSGGS